MADIPVVILHEGDGLPRVTTFMGGINFGVCELFLKKAGTNAWTSLINFNGANASEHVYVLDHRGEGLRVFDKVKFGWTVVFTGFDEDPNSPYSFKLDISQDGGRVMHPQFHKEGTFITPGKPFTSLVEFSVL